MPDGASGFDVMGAAVGPLATWRSFSDTEEPMQDLHWVPWRRSVSITEVWPSF
jgi:hypothetical protein